MTVWKGFALLLLSLGAVHSASQFEEEIGQLNGGAIRVLMPVQWNGQLVIWCDGYNPEPVQFRMGTRPSGFVSALLDQGYAVAEAGSRGGVAVNEAIQDAEALRLYFRRKHPRTKAVFALGESMGGLVALRLVETFPSHYKGGLSYCGLLSTPSEYVRRAYDLLTSFTNLHPNILPTPNRIPASYRPSEELMRIVTQALANDRESGGRLMREADVNNVEDLGSILVFHTDLLRWVSERCGGGVACLDRVGQPRRSLARPFLAVESSYDPVVPERFVNTYLRSIAGTTAQAFFVRQSVKANGHCSLPLRSRLSAFSDLVRWTATVSARPKAGLRSE